MLATRLHRYNILASLVSLCILSCACPALAQTSTWSGGGGHNEWNENASWTGPWTGSSVDAVIDLAPQFAPFDWTVELNDSLLTQQDLFIELNTLTVGPVATLQIADSLDFTGTAQTTLTNHGLIQVRDQNGPHALHLVRDVNNVGVIQTDHNVFAATNWLIVDSDGANLKGGGTVELGGNLGSQITGPAGALLTIENQTVSGRGSVGTDTLQIHNSANGIILANNGTMTLNAGSLGVTNAGVVRASGTGNVLVIDDTDIDNANGVIESQSGGNVTTTSSTSITGGLLDGDGQFVMQSPLLTNVTNAATNVLVPNSHDLRLSGTFNNLGQVQVTHTNLSNPTSVAVQSGGAVLDGGGTITLSGNVAQINGASGAVLTIQNQTIQGRGQIGADLIEIVNEENGLIDATTGTITFDNGGSGAINRGRMRASAGGTLRIEGTTLNNTDGSIESQLGGTVNFFGSTITGGLLEGDGLFNVEWPLFVDVTTTATNMRVNNARDLLISGSFNNAGNIAMLRSSGGDPTSIDLPVGDATISGGGTIDLGAANWGTNITGIAGAVLTIDDQTITGGGAFNTFGDDMIEIVTTAHAKIISTEGITIDPFGPASNTFVNNGLLRASNELGSTFLTITHDTLNNGAMSADAGSSITANTLETTAGSLLAGGGTIQSTGHLSIAGTVAPGNSPGTLRLNANGPIQFGSSADVQIEIAGASDHDLLILNAGGDLTLDGTLSISAIDGYVPTPTDVFSVLSLSVPNGSSILGSFVNSSGTVRTQDGLGIFDFQLIANGTTGSVELTNFLAFASGDFDNNGDWGCSDVDALVAEIVSGNNLAPFDINLDGQVDQLDLDDWLAQAGAARGFASAIKRGDANLNGVVDGADFLTWNDHKFTTSTSFCNGDFTGDGAIDAADFIAWNDNKFTTSDSPVAVPEPNCAGMLLLLLGLSMRRRDIVSR